jgi:N-acetylmuramoyl-L-alanine amidase
MLDPGHGGRDPGVVRRNYGTRIIKESHIALIASQVIAIKLRKEGFLVKMTRVDDSYVAQWRRCFHANRWKADFFLSIHVNSFVTPIPRGFEVHYYPSSLKGRLVSRGIVGKYLQLVERYREYILHGTGLFASDYKVLRSTSMPAALVELGFMPNDDDLDLLTSPEGFGLTLSAITDYLCSDQFRGMIDK